jgi:hypothetical protein
MKDEFANLHNQVQELLTDQVIDRSNIYDLQLAVDALRDQNTKQAQELKALWDYVTRDDDD